MSPAPVCVIPWLDSCLVGLLSRYHAPLSRSSNPEPPSLEYLDLSYFCRKADLHNRLGTSMMVKDDVQSKVNDSPLSLPPSSPRVL